MNIDQFEQLLYEEESTVLDFKQAQYRFVGASDEEKSELLKDILGFANAWRRSEAYILIGVEEVRGGRSNVIGIDATNQLDDHSLQQFVSNLTNSPVQFQYSAFTAKDKQVGIIRIEHQPRPIYLKRDYGKLKKKEVYVRRGSSTTASKPADLDEIARMGKESAPEAAEIAIEFADTERDHTLGSRRNLETEYCEMPPTESIPDFVHHRPQRSAFGFDLPAFNIDPMRRTNTNYFRELASYEFAHRLLRPIRLMIMNVGQVAAQSVQIEIALPKGNGDLLIDSSDLPDASREIYDPLHHSIHRAINPMFDRSPGAVVFDINNDRVRININCGDLQPGRQVWSETIYAGKRRNGELVLLGKIFADNLPRPSDFTLSLAFSVVESRLTVDELCDLPKPQIDE